MARSRRLAPVFSSALGCLFVLTAGGRAEAAEYYVAPTGNDSSAGTLDQPFATLQKGGDSAAAGDTVWFRAGTYKVTRQVVFTKSGQSDAKRIKYFAYKSEVPVFDFSGDRSTNSARDVPGIEVRGSWLHFKGLEIANLPMSGSGSHSNSAMRSQGASNNIYELLNIHHTSGPGLFIDTGTGGNLILNCDSHDNYDANGSQGDGQNGDGFGVHYQSTGPSTIIRGCRAWNDSDDGYDLISQEVPVVIENSWAFGNGYANNGTTKPSSGNGNGFKAGSSKTGIRHTLQRCVAWKNRAAGFYANHSSGGNNWYNNTAYNNATAAYNMLASPAGNTDQSIELSGNLAHKMRNNIGFPNKNSNMGGVDTKSNTWDLGIAEAASDFVSTSDADCAGPRQADGSLPATSFLKLKAGSPLIDKGTDVSLPFTGASPDLGAHEYGSVDTGAGGAPTTSDAGAIEAGGAGAGAGGASAGSGGTAGAAGSGTGGTSDPGTGGFNAGSGGSNDSAGSGGDSAGAAGLASQTGGASSGPTTGSGTGTLPPAADPAGCACTVGGSKDRAFSLPLVLGVLGALGAFARRRRRAA